MGSKGRGNGRGRVIVRSTGKGRGRGGRRQPTIRIIDETTGSHIPKPNQAVVGMVIPQVPWVGPAPSSSEVPVSSVVPNNHMGVYEGNQGTPPKQVHQLLNKPRLLIVDGKPLEIPNKSISKDLQVSNPSVIPSKQFESISVQAQMAETGELALPSAAIVPRSRAAPAKGQRNSFKTKVQVRRELYQGSDDEMDSNAEDEDEDEDYEESLKKQARRTMRRKPLRKQAPGRQDVSVPVGNIKKEVEDPMQQQQQETEHVGETSDLLQQQQSSVPIENTEGIQNLKLENVSGEAEENTGGTSEMQVDTEGTLGDAESGLVVTTGADVKPDVRKLKAKSRRLLSPTRRQLKRPIIKKPRIPMRESLAVNFSSRDAEKRRIKKKYVDHETIVRTEKFQSKPKEMKEKTELKLVVPKYTASEKELLYGDKRFVIDINSVDKAPEQIFIWQIHRSEYCLRQYYPSKYGEKQFFISSPVKWYFFQEEFESDEFYSRFLPIVVITANVSTQKIERQSKKLHVDEYTVQYVYVDKPFFVRVLKSIGKIDVIEFLRPFSMNSLAVHTLIATDPLFLSRNFEDPKIRARLEESRKAFQYIKEFIDKLLAKVFFRFPFEKKILQHLLDFPSLILSAKDVDKTKSCSACNRSVPYVAAKFPTRGHMEKPYDRYTLIELVPENFPQSPGVMNLCRDCSTAAKKLHRLLHFQYHLLKLIKQNSARDIAMFHKYHTQISDEILLWIQGKDVSRKNVMFLDFQVAVAKVQAEFCARPTVAADAPTPTPTPIADPDPAAVVVNEI